MLKVLKYRNIISDCDKIYQFEGRLLKIVICCDQIPIGTEILFETDDGEILYDNTIQNTKQCIYPINKITEQYFEEVSDSDVIIVDEVYKDYFYITGGIRMRIKGLQETDKINMIKIVYETSRDY